MEAISMSTIINTTNLENNLILLTECINKGHIEKSNTLLSPYFKMFDELIISEEELILPGEK